MSKTIEMLRGLVETIYQQTLEEAIKWDISQDKSQVFANIDSYKIEITDEPSDDFGHDIRYTIYDSSGDQIDTFSDTTLRNYIPTVGRFPNYFGIMSETQEMAKRQATGADKAIASLLSALGGAPISDPPPPAIGFTDDLDSDVPF